MEARSRRPSHNNNNNNNNNNSRTHNKGIIIKKIALGFSLVVVVETSQEVGGVTPLHLPQRPPPPVAAVLLSTTMTTPSMRQHDRRTPKGE